MNPEIILAVVDARAELLRRVVHAIRNDDSGLATVRAMLNHRAGRSEAPKAEKLSGIKSK